MPTAANSRAVALPVPISHLSVQGYRSIRTLWTRLEGANVVLGPNGSGKTNLYRSLALLVEAAHGRLARSVAREGGMPSLMWAGGRRKHERHGLIVEVRFDAFDYRIEVGLVTAIQTIFKLDPEVKQESVTFTEARRKPVTLMERAGPTAWMRDDDGKRVTYPLELSSSESVLSQLRDRHRYPEIASISERIQGWRFYHHFRTDPEAPMRQPQVGVRTHVLAGSGDDLAAAIQTIREVGDEKALDEVVGDASRHGSREHPDGPAPRRNPTPSHPGVLDTSSTAADPPPPRLEPFEARAGAVSLSADLAARRGLGPAKPR